jgi:hypothetical protein
MRVTPTAEDVKVVAQAYGAMNGSSEDYLQSAFGGTFREVIHEAVKDSRGDELAADRPAFKERLRSATEALIIGFVLDDVIINNVAPVNTENGTPEA